MQGGNCDGLCQVPCGSVTVIDVFSLRLQGRVRTGLKEERREEEERRREEKRRGGEE